MCTWHCAGLFFLFTWEEGKEDNNLLGSFARCSVGGSKDMPEAASSEQAPQEAMAAPPLAKPGVEERPAAYSVAATPHAPVQDAPHVGGTPASAGRPPVSGHSRGSGIASSRVQSSIEGLRSHMGARPCMPCLPHALPAHSSVSVRQQPAPIGCSVLSC